MEKRGISETYQEESAGFVIGEMMSINRVDSDKIVYLLENKYPEAECALHYEGDPWKLLIMGILSAQCTDKRVNMVCEDLFKTFPTPEIMGEAEQTEIEKHIKECGLYHAKAKSLKEASYDIAHKFSSKVPDNMEDLLSLRGVGRKIGNLILGDIYYKPAVVCDTHCIRISSRLGYTKKDEKDPVRTEKVLSKIIPDEKQSDFCHRLVLFGRETCIARNPRCSDCILSDLCRYKKITKTNI